MTKSIIYTLHLNTAPRNGSLTAAALQAFDLSVPDPGDDHDALKRWTQARQQLAVATRNH
ncbi:MAG: hypothetical protein OIF57_06775 [Marinobacterium sp.]|nr:hypothetical protein [Marinobacterium sp.]